MTRCARLARPRPHARTPRHSMFRHPLMLILLVLGGLLVLGLLAIGAFPPSVSPQPVERTIPAERFGTR